MFPPRFVHGHFTQFVAAFSRENDGRSGPGLPQKHAPLDAVNLVSSHSVCTDGKQSRRFRHRRWHPIERQKNNRAHEHKRGAEIERRGGTAGPFRPSSADRRP
jgi:hypothetical protein